MAILPAGHVHFLAIIIPAGATMSRMATGKFGWLCAVAILDLSIGTGLPHPACNSEKQCL